MRRLPGGERVHNFKIEPVLSRITWTGRRRCLKTGAKKRRLPNSGSSLAFFFCGTYIYVFDTLGECLVDPAFPGLENRDMLPFRTPGHYVVKEMLKVLESQDRARLRFMASPKPGTTLPSRKLAYLRKVTVKGESLIIMSDFSLASPIWMRH